MSAQDDPPLGVEVFSHWRWPKALHYTFSPSPPDSSPSSGHSGGGSSVILVAPE